jgi:hypothetical protein
MDSSDAILRETGKVSLCKLECLVGVPLHEAEKKGTDIIKTKRIILNMSVIY